MLKKAIALILLAAITITILPSQAFAGENEDIVTELSRKTYILDLVGTEDSPEYRTGSALSSNMNAFQIETGLDELLTTEIGEPLHELEDIITYSQNNDLNTVMLGNEEVNFDEVVDLLNQIRKVWTEAKGCRDIISEDRSFILAALEGLETEGIYTSEHERESAAYQILKRSEELEKQITIASDLYSDWMAITNNVKKYLSSSTNSSDELQTKIGLLKSDRVSKMKQIASRESNGSSKDIVIDVVSIYEIRIYALDEDGKPLKDAEIYCWPVNEDDPNPNKGQARHPNNEGYVTIPTAELGADDNHFMTAGYEIICPGYRTQYAQANYIKGGEIFWCHLQENDPKEDVYVAGISLNGYDCKWYEKELYITDENTADQTVELFLRSQSGADFNGTAQMKYLNKDSKDYTTLSSDYSSSAGMASAVFKSKLCQEIAGEQENAMTFRLSTSTSNDEITPTLKSATAKISKTEYVQNDSIIDALYFGQISLSWPGDSPFLNSMSLNFDVGQLLNGHFYVLTNCSGLWAAFASTTQQPMTKSIEKLNNSWMTADSKKIEQFTNSEFNRYAGFAKQEIDSEYKTLKYDNHIPGTYGGKKIYGNGTIAAFGSYSAAKEMDFTVLLGLQFGFRGDWTKQFFLSAIPVKVGWGFDMSASAFFKFGFKGWEYSGTDITVAIRLMGYMSGGPGIRIHMFGKTFSAALGFRFQLGLLLNLPIFTTMDGVVEDKIFTFNLGLSFYADFFFVHFIWNLWSGTGEWNITQGTFEFKSKPFWEDDDSASALASAGGISLGDTEYANTTTIEEETSSQDDINGDTLWTYSSYEFTKEEDSVPSYFTLHWDGSGSYKADCDYIFWVENEKAVKYTPTNYSEGYAGTFNFPAEIQSKIDSGDWKITSVRAAAHPEVYDVHVRMGSTDTIQTVQLATVSATIGTDWVTKTDEQDGQTITRELPTGTVVVTRVYLYDGTFQNLRYPDSNDDLHEVIFVDQFDTPISDAIGMIYNIKLKGFSPRGTTQLVEDIVMDMDSNQTALEDSENDAYNENNGAKLVSFGTSDDPDNIGMVYFLSNQPTEEIVASSLRNVSISDSRPVKQLIGGAGHYGFIMALLEDGSIWNISAYRALTTEVSDDASLGEMDDIAIIRTDFVENSSADYTLFCSPKASDTSAGGQNASLQSVSLAFDEMYCTTEVFTDYDVELNGAPIFAGRLMNENYLYWFEGFQDEETGENHTAVKGMCYSPQYNMMTSPYRLGVLTGSDGTPPAGCSVSTTPVYSHVMSDGNMIITKSWLPSSDENQSDEDQVLSSFKVNVVRRVSAELMGAGTEMPAVSAGRDCNMLFTIINKGNVPVLGFDFNIYHKNTGGEQELVQSSHIDLTDPANNQVTFLKSGYSEAHPVIFEGDYSARRIGGLFDQINKDEWNITRSTMTNGLLESNGSIFVNVPALMPEGIQTYTMIFAVPIDWAHKTEITCEVNQTYVPKYVADIFALSDATGADEEDRSSMPVLAVKRSAEDEQLLSPGEGATADITIAGSLNGFTESVSNDLTSPTDEFGNPMIYTYTPSDHDVEFNVVNLSIKCHVFEKNGEKYATITIFQDGQTDHTAPRGVTLQAWIDDEKYPCFVHTFNTHHENGQLAYSFTLPVSTLTDGRTAERLTLGVSDTVEENEEMSAIDDTCELVLNNTLMIQKQPENISVIVGQDAEFSVEAVGGTEPYEYHWQKLENGNWKDFKTTKEPTLILKKTSIDTNGTTIRCIIKDHSGKSVTSTSATLTVKEKPDTPDTGDSNYWILWLLAIVLMSMGIGGSLILRRRDR